MNAARGTVPEQTRLSVKRLLERGAAALQSVPITINGADGRSVTVQANVDHRTVPEALLGFVKSNGHVSISGGALHPRAG